MKNITLVMVMIFAAISGYFIGSYSGRNAKEALANAEVAAKLSAADHEKAVKQLNDHINKLDREYEADKKLINDSYQKQQAKWAELLAGRDKRIVELGKTSAATGTEIEKLRGNMKDMALQEERQRTAERIAKLEKELKEQQILIAGLECSKVAVPAEILSKFKGGAQ